MRHARFLTFIALALLAFACGTEPELEETPSDSGSMDTSTDAEEDASDTGGPDARVDVEPVDAAADVIEDGPSADATPIDTMPSDVPLTDTGGECPSENPAGCTATGCDDGEECFTFYSSESICVSSGCACDAASGLWMCDDDCGGGICVPEPGTVACASDADCIFGAQWCEEGVCVTCSNDSFLCDIDCAFGLVERHGCYPCECNPPPECELPPTGCYDDGECQDGEVCAPSDTFECIPSSCGCEPETGEIWCTDDCAPGRCAPSACGGPSPAGCVDSGCPEGQSCETSAAGVCIPSSCMCDEESGGWICTDDCGGGICVPDAD